jgi:hypothetical protein
MTGLIFFNSTPYVPRQAVGFFAGERHFHGFARKLILQIIGIVGCIEKFYFGLDSPTHLTCRPVENSNGGSTPFLSPGIIKR